MGLSTHMTASCIHWEFCSKIVVVVTHELFFFRKRFREAKVTQIRLESGGVIYIYAGKKGSGTPFWLASF
jgi:hypothetical protein